MADEKDMKQAQAVYAALCQTLDSNEWHYKKDDSKLTIECGIQGDDLPMDITIKVDAGRYLILLLSHIPFTTPEDKRIDLAVAVSIVNNRLVEGSFDYDVKSGHMFFRMTNSFLESTIGKEVFLYMIYGSCKIIDEFNDKFMMLSKGLISLEKFIEMYNN